MLTDRGEEVEEGSSCGRKTGELAGTRCGVGKSASLRPTRTRGAADPRSGPDRPRTHPGTVSTSLRVAVLVFQGRQPGSSDRAAGTAARHRPGALGAARPGRGAGRLVPPEAVRESVFPPRSLACRSRLFSTSSHCLPHACVRIQRPPFTRKPVILGQGFILTCPPL